MALPDLARPMNWYRKISVFVVAGVLYLAGQYLRGYWWPLTTWPLTCHLVHFGTSTYCDPQYLDQAFALIAAGKVFLAVAVILLFANAKGWSRWLKFSYFYVPIATILVLWLFPFDLPPGITIPLESGVWDFGFLYVLITLGFVLYSRWKS